MLRLGIIGWGKIGASYNKGSIFSCVGSWCETVQEDIQDMRHNFQQRKLEEHLGRGLILSM